MEQKLICFITGEEYPKSEMVEVGDEWIHESISDKYYACDDCGSIVNRDIMFETESGDIICDDCRVDSYFECADCGNLCHTDSAIYITRPEITVCERCYAENYFQCDSCGNYYHNDYYGGDNCCEDCFQDDDQIDIYDKDGRYQTTSAETNLPKQSVIDTPDNIQTHLEDFYDGRYDSFIMNDWKNITRTYKLKLEKDLNSVKELLSKIPSNIDPYLESPYFVNKYTRIKIISTDGVTVKYEYVDNFGNKKEKTEKLNSMYEYIVGLYGKDNVDKYFKREGSLPNREFMLEMSNDLDHKLRTAKANNASGAFYSCQTPDNCMSYSHGYHDRFANGCNCPVLITLNGTKVGRILVRLFLDKEGNEYMFIDRLYLNDSYSNYRLDILLNLIKELNKERPIILSTYTEHETVNMFEYISRHLPNDIAYITPEESLRQPMREYGDIECGYYHDSGTRTWLDNNSGLVYDRVGKDKIKILPKNSF